MDVTRSNFSKVYQGLEKVVSESSFLAIDGEFTGLIDGGADVAAYDTYSEYYSKLKNGSLNFLFVQFGLCAFKYNAERKRWTHTAYNFYTFPKPFSRQADDARFLCQTSSMDFLACNGFDFNKLFREGISYLSVPEEERLRARLAERQAQVARNATPGREGSVPVPEDQATFVAENCALIKEFIASERSERELPLPRCSAFQRKLLYQAVQESFSDKVRLETRTDAQPNFVAIRVGSPEEMLALEEERKEKQVREIDDAVGFSKVIRLLSSSGKLIAGHNMMLDMMHVLDQFCAPVPEAYLEFKDMLHETFPRLVDTKYMSACAPFKEHVRSNALSELHARLSEEPFTMPTADCDTLGAGYPSLTDKYHEAGYDALVTGLCFLAMAKHLDPKLLHPDISTLPRIEKYINKVLLFRMQDFGYMALGGNDPFLPRDHVFHLTMPREWKQHDVVRLFQPVGPVFVSWVDDTTAFVALHEREKAGCVAKMLPRSALYRVTSWKARQLGEKALAQTALVPESPTTVSRKRRSLELLTAAPAPPDEGDKRRKKTAQLPKGSLFSRRSIDPIAEERETSSPQVQRNAGGCGTFAGRLADSITRFFRIFRTK